MKVQWPQSYVKWGALGGLLLAAAAGIAAGGLLLVGGGGANKREPQARDEQARLAIRAVDEQLTAIIVRNYKAACDKFSPLFFVYGGNEPTRCQSTLSGNFSGKAIVYRIRLGGTYTETKAIVVFEIAIGRDAQRCRELWKMNESSACSAATDFAAILFRQGAGWRVVALNTI